MKPEALDAITSQTMRPEALDAATTPIPQGDSNPDERLELNQPKSPNSKTPSSIPSSPKDSKTDPTQAVVQVVEGVVNGVKAAIDGVLTWAEEKAEGLSTESEDTGPYSSPALCAPSDLDPIASGVLPAMPSESPQKEEQKETEDKKSEGAEKSDDAERKA